MHYLAYGSNLHPLRLVLRVPGAMLVGITHMAGAKLTFHKRSSDGSAKCNLELDAGSPFGVHGAVYDIPLDEIALLDKFEGLGKGYFKSQMQVIVEGRLIPVFTYLASSSHLSADLTPYHWYKGLVVAGARKHNFPKAYVEYIESWPSQSDPDATRRIEMENLLEQLVD